MDPSPPTFSSGDPAAAKATLRARFRAARKEHVAALPEGTRALLFRRPPAPLLGLIPQAATIGLYYPHPHEAPTLAYARWFYENGNPLALPYFADRSGEMEFRAWADPYDDEALEPGPFGVLQPRAHAPAVTPDAAFLPLLAFTDAGERLGQGGGHYDRWLAAHPQALAMGLAWDAQRAESLPVEKHDRPLDAVVTPTRLYKGER